MELLTATVREQNTTVVLVTHEPRVAAYADRAPLTGEERREVERRVSAALGERGWT